MFYLFIGIQMACAQVEAPALRPVVEQADFDKRLTQLLSFTVPLIGVKELEEKKEEVLLLDVRELEEYQVSHIPGAQHLGYKKFSKKLLKEIPKDTTIVLYCSVGYRSEKMGERLHKMGFTNVQNLYGSIFEWANQELPLSNEAEKETKEVHTYNRTWSKWVSEEEVIKVW